MGRDARRPRPRLPLRPLGRSLGPARARCRGHAKPIGVASGAGATSCLELAVIAELEPVAVTIDGEPVADPLEVAPRDPTFARGASGIAWLDSSTLAIDLEEESP